ARHLHWLEEARLLGRRARGPPIHTARFHHLDGPCMDLRAVWQAARGARGALGVPARWTGAPPRRAGAHLARRAQGRLPDRAGACGLRRVFPHQAAVHPRAAHLWSVFPRVETPRAATTGGVGFGAHPSPASVRSSDRVRIEAPSRHLLVLPEGGPLLVRWSLRRASAHAGRSRDHLRLDDRPPNDRRTDPW